MSHSDFTVVSLAEPAQSAIDDHDPDCCDSMAEFTLGMINDLIADLHLVANVLTSRPETELPPRTWYAISGAFQALTRDCQNLRN